MLHHAEEPSRRRPFHARHEATEGKTQRWKRRHTYVGNLLPESEKKNTHQQPQSNKYPIPGLRFRASASCVEVMNRHNGHAANSAGNKPYITIGT